MPIHSPKSTDPAWDSNRYDVEAVPNNIWDGRKYDLREDGTTQQWDSAKYTIESKLENAADDYIQPLQHKLTSDLGDDVLFTVVISDSHKYVSVNDSLSMGSESILSNSAKLPSDSIDLISSNHSEHQPSAADSASHPIPTQSSTTYELNDLSTNDQLDYDYIGPPSNSPDTLEANIHNEGYADIVNSATSDIPSTSYKKPSTPKITQTLSFTDKNEDEVV